MEAFKKQEALKPYFENAYGYAFFDTVAKAGIGIGGAGGKGIVFLNNKDGTEVKIGESTLMQVSWGIQFGGTVYSEIIFFESEKDLEHFTSGNFEFGANAGATALTMSANTGSSSMGGHQGVSTSMSADETKFRQLNEKYVKGVKVFTVTKGGLMYEASISGQKFSYKPIVA